MPIAQERALMRVAARKWRDHTLRKKKGDTKKKAIDRFVYGIMRHDGWTPGAERKR